MKFVILVEGHTEEESLPEFIKRYLESHIPGEKIEIEADRMSGWQDFNKNAIQKAKDYLEAPDNKKIIAVIGILDLYGP
jgi:hypothetical protein